MRSQPDWRIIDTEETALLSHHYQIIDIIEKGPICTVYRAVQRNTSKTYTIKSIDVRKYNIAAGLSEKDIHKEVEICALLTHPFLCQLRDVIEGPNVVHMIFDYVEGTDICFEIVKRAGSGFVYSEAVASHYIRQLVEAVQYMHSKNILHRDIRPHNLLLSSKDNNASLKLRGSSIAVKLESPDEKCQPGRIGIPHFMAPEVVANLEYDFQAEMWSVGVLLYLLLSGKLPFTGSKEHIYECITEGKYSLIGSPWCYISDLAKDLLTRLLTVDPKARISCEQCLKHMWLADKSVPLKKHLSETVENIRQYNQRRKLKSNIIAAVNNARWNKFPIHSFLSADSMPGGDACDSDCTHRGPEVSTAEDMVGVEKILSSLDQMAILFDRSLVMDAAADDELQKALNDPGFRDILLLYDRISNQRVRPSAINHNAEQQLNEVRNELAGLLNPSNEALELSSLLDNPHLHAIIQASDIVLEEVYATCPFETNEFPSSTVPGTIELHNLANDVNALASPPALTYTSVGENDLKQQPLANAIPISAQTHTGKPFSYANVNGSLVQMVSGASSGLPSNPMVDLDVAIPSTSTAGVLNRLDGPVYDDDDDLVANTVSRVRLVQFQKDTEEPMGITLKIIEDGRCLVARIMHGGMIHRQATLHVGDEIREINGISVANKNVDALQRMLRDARGNVTFKIVPSYRSAPPACEIYVRAQFDYDPVQDDLIPCPQAGIPFKTGDILQVISKDDHNWWQARYVCAFPGLGNVGSTSASMSPSLSQMANHHPSTAGSSLGAPIAGLIPSPELQEWRTACLAMERAKEQSHCMWFNKRKKYYTTKYLRKHSDLFEQLDLVTYEEVIRLSSFRRKTLVLLGAHGVGRRHIKNTLITRHPQRFAYPIPHTTRPPRKDEVDGNHYYFVPNDQMLIDIQNNEYLEYGMHDDCMYGTKLETIRSIHRSGKMAILDVEPQALKVLRTAEYSPFVVFIAAPDLHGLQDPDGSLERLVRESEILRQAFGHLFDYVICNNDIDETIRQLETVVEKLNAIPQWVPVSWVY